MTFWTVVSIRVDTGQTTLLMFIFIFTTSELDFFPRISFLLRAQLLIQSVIIIVLLFCIFPTDHFLIYYYFYNWGVSFVHSVPSKIICSSLIFLTECTVILNS